MTTNKKKTTRKPLVLDAYSMTRGESDMLDWFDGKLIGQPDAREAAVRMKSVALSKLKDPEKAAGMYYLIGEPGVGKSELIKLLALYIHGNRRAYVKIDGGSLREKHHANRLIGAPPGYVGYEEPEKAAEREAKELAEIAADPDAAARKWRKNPRKLLCRKNLVNSRMGSKVPLTIVFIDEAEKLHDTVDDFLLNAVEDGILPLGDGEDVEVGDVLFVFAGNPGSKEAVNRKERMGFIGETAEEKETATKEIIMNALKDRYRPEMLDRFDEFIYFVKLGKEDLRSITRLRIDEVVNRFCETMERGTAFTIQVDDSARDFMLEKALKENGNARRIGRAVRKYFTNPLSRLIDRSADREDDVLLTSDDLLVVTHDMAYMKGELLKFELYEDEGVRAPQDTLAPSSKDTPLALKHAGFDRQLTAAAEAAKKLPKNVYAVAMTHESQLQALQEVMVATREAVEILRMPLVEYKARVSAPWTMTLFFEATEAQAELLKKHYPTATVTLFGKAKPASNDQGEPGGKSMD